MFLLEQVPLSTLDNIKLQQAKDSEFQEIMWFVNSRFTQVDRLPRLKALDNGA